jgi:FkbM family methyltransferase
MFGRDKLALASSLFRVLYKSLEWGRGAELLDLFYFYRLLLGRNPDGAELADLRRKCGRAPARDVLSTILLSPEYSRQPRFLPPGHELVSDVNGFLFRFRTGDRDMGVPMAFGDYEPHIVDIIRKHAVRSSCMIDCGAHTGFLSCHYLSAAPVASRVIAIEPSPENARLLRANLTANGFLSRGEVHECACGAAAGETSMGSVGTMLVGGAGEARVTVPVVSLDEIVRGPVDLVKLDVEGAEPQVWSGMRRILEESRPLVLVEANDYWLRRVSNVSAQDLVDLVESSGYRVVGAAGFSRGEEVPVVLDPDDPLFVTDLVAIPR